MEGGDERTDYVVPYNYYFFIIRICTLRLNQTEVVLLKERKIGAVEYLLGLVMYIIYVIVMDLSVV